MYTLEYLVTIALQTQTITNGKWIPARPLKDGFLERLKDAWEVLQGRADAFIWPEGQ